jgi:uncharacterized protein (TIGR04255 family)
MPVSLPEPNRDRLARSPLSLAACQLNFERTLKVGEQNVASRFHEALGGTRGDYPNPVQARGVTLNVSVGTPGASFHQEEAQGWAFSSEDGSWSILLMPEGVTLQTTAYTTWEDDFLPRLERVLAALTEAVDPQRETRLGLRYINRIEPDGDAVEDWSQWIQPHILGPLGHEDLSDGIRASRQQFTVELAGDLICVVQAGVIVDEAESSAYLLDFDVHRVGERPLSEESALEGANALNTQALAMFQSSVTPTYLERCAADVAE